MDFLVAVGMIPLTIALRTNADPLRIRCRLPSSHPARNGSVAMLYRAS